ncbi:MAG: hypothetical protein AAB834_00080, partial [Patescibacteria group bacterium]
PGLGGWGSFKYVLGSVRDRVAPDPPDHVGRVGVGLGLTTVSTVVVASFPEGIGRRPVRRQFRAMLVVTAVTLTEVALHSRASS